MQSYNYANVCKTMLSKAHNLTHYVILRLQLEKLCSIMFYCQSVLTMSILISCVRGKTSRSIVLDITFHKQIWGDLINHCDE
jgi:hypothetical protein